MIIDTHFHTSTMRQKKLPLDFLSHTKGIDIGTEPLDIRERLEIVQGYPDIRTSQAAGPWCATGDLKDVDRLIAELEQGLELHPSTFIGECGLDYYWDYGTREVQKALFSAQLDLARRRSLPVIIHSREADEDMLEILEGTPLPNSGIMHCFSMGAREMERLVGLGLLISFAGNVTYKANHKILDAYLSAPLDSILVETDAPYLSPIPVRGKPNTPEYTEHTLAFLARARGLEQDELKSQVERNYERLLTYSLNAR